MKKRRLMAATIASIMLISGCSGAGDGQGEDNSADTTPSAAGFDDTAGNLKAPSDSSDWPEDAIIIKWGMDKFSREDGKAPFTELNQKLASEGSKVRVEAVKLDIGKSIELTFGDLVKEYEGENGNLDIVTYGSEWLGKIGAANSFFKSGYFRELTEEEIKQFTDIPEIFWDACKVNGKNYSVPALSFGTDSDFGLYYYFNNKYITADKLESFDSTLPKLEEVLDNMPSAENAIVLEYQFDYLDFTAYTSDSTMGSLFLSGKTMKAMNPYEAEEVIEYARQLNSLYNKGYMNYEIDFTPLKVYEGNNARNNEYITAPFAVLSGGKMSDADIDKRLGSNNQVSVFSLPYYQENMIIGSTGIPVNSNHPEEAMKLLVRLHSDKEFSGLLTPEERYAIGLPKDNQPVSVENRLLSPFAEFELEYTDIDKYKEVKDLCEDFFDTLCKAEDFDKTLAEINEELKEAGIDEYVALVNQRLEESGIGTGVQISR